MAHPSERVGQVAGEAPCGALGGMLKPSGFGWSAVVHNDASAIQGGRDSRKLVQCRLEVLHDSRRYDLRRWQILGVLQGFVPEPEDVQGCLVPGNEFFV